MIKKLLGIELLERDIMDLSMDDVKLADKIRVLRKDINEIIVYLGIERIEAWGEDKKYTPPQSRVISSKFVKKNEKNDKKGVRRTK